MKIYHLSVALLAITCIAGGLSLPGHAGQPLVLEPGKWTRSVMVPFEKGGESGVSVQIYVPGDYKPGEKIRTLIMLPEYDGNEREWENSTPIAQEANALHLAIVCPNTAGTVYESAYYPETVKKWGPVPGTLFIGEVLVPYLQSKFSLAADRKRTGICGIGMGARGAILVAAKYNRLFCAAAGLSGVYDPGLLSRPLNSLTAVYGSYKSFPERWDETDNVIKLAPELKGTAVFLAHGDSDSQVPSNQSVALAITLNTLQKKGGGYDSRYKAMRHHAHDWRCWRRVFPEVMRFFGEKLAQ